MGIGNHLLVDFLRQSGFAEKEAKNGESLAKRQKMGALLCSGILHKTRREIQKKCGGRTLNAIAW